MHYILTLGSSFASERPMAPPNDHPLSSRHSRRTNRRHPLSHLLAFLDSSSRHAASPEELRLNSDHWLRLRFLAAQADRSPASQSCPDRCLAL